MAMVRKKIKWPTKRRKGGTRVWKSRWMTIWSSDKPAAKTPPKTGEKAAAEKAAAAEKSAAARA